MSDTPQKSWQARIGESTDAIAQKFVESISYDRRIYKQDIAGSIAHATMLAKVGLITDAERDAIIEGLKGIERDIESGNFVFDESLEDIHMVIEAALIKRIGEPGRKLHTGRSRNDQVATDLAAVVVRSKVMTFNDSWIGPHAPNVCQFAGRSEARHRDAVVHSHAAGPADLAGPKLSLGRQCSRRDRIRLLNAQAVGLRVVAHSEAERSRGTSLPLDARTTSIEMQSIYDSARGDRSSSVDEIRLDNSLDPKIFTPNGPESSSSTPQPAITPATSSMPAP